MQLRSTVLLALLFPATLSAQTIRGVVVEYGTNTYVVGATVEVLNSRGSAARAMTDSIGRFVVYPPFSGRVLVRATHPSFAAERTDTVTMRPKETVTLVVRMTRQAIPLAPLVVTARSSSVLGGFYERQRRNAYGRFIEEKEIERKRPVSVEHLMRDVPGVQIEVTQGSSAIKLRGLHLERCTAAVFVDGMPMKVTGYDLEHLVPLGRIAAVEIYQDPMALPFEFMSIGNECGAVAFWTHPATARRDGFLTWKRAVSAVGFAAGLLVLEGLLIGR